MAYNQYVNPIEKRIIDAIIRKALKVGYTISVYDGEEWPVKRSTDYELITADIAQTDETTLRFRSSGGDNLGVIWLVHGNDEDVVSDMTDNETMQFLTMN